MSEFPNGWEKWSQHVLSTMENQSNKINCLESKLHKVHEDVAIIKATSTTHDDYMQLREEIVRLKTQAKIWGGIAGFITGAAIPILCALFL